MILLLIKWLRNLFSRKTRPPQLAPASLPHPEEKPDYTRTVENVSVPAVIESWFQQWAVPARYREWWRQAVVITVKADLHWDNPGDPVAWAYMGEDGKRHVDSEPAWLNPGVIAHEQSHNAWALLAEVAREEFGRLVVALAETDPYLKLQWGKNPIGLADTIEAHANTYRYLGGMMPTELKKFYPRLF